ncbi:ABC transporter permease [Bacteroidota bacterium]
MIKKIWSSLIIYIPENNAIERIWILAKTDFKKRYYDTSLGLIWALLNPLFRFFVYYLVFTKIFTNRIENYSLYLFLGLIIWTFFSESTKRGAVVLRANSHIINNLEIRIFEFFLASLFSSIIGFTFNFIVFVCVSFFQGIFVSQHIIILPILLLNLFLLGLGFSFILSSLYIFFKDIAMIWNLILIGGFWITPIIYSGVIFTQSLPILLYLNPLAGIMINIREILIYHNWPDWELMTYDMFYCIILFIVGYYLVKKFSTNVAERLI